MLYLFGPKETDFVNGDSDLIHNTYDEVVDRSKGFYLKFKIALDKDKRYKNIKKEMIISAYTPDGWNQFRVFDIYNHSNYVEVVATQLHYDLNYKKVFPFNLNRATAQVALNVFVNNLKSELPNFKFTSNITDTHNFSTDDDLERLDEGHNALEILNRIATRWGGELKVDGYNVHLVSKLGKFTNALLYEHKNISEFVDETSMSEIVTRIHAVSRFRLEREEGSANEPEEVVIKVVVDSPLIDEYAQVYEEDFTNNDARTREQLIAWARLKYSSNNVDKPTRSIQVETNIIDGQEINYGDDLVLKYTKHDVDEIIRCVGYQYNPNSRQYISVTLGSNINSMASTITGAVHDSTKNQISNIEKQVQIIKYAANNVNRVTTGPLPIPDPIEGDMWYYHPEGRPNEVELRIFQDGGWVTIVSDMTGENVRKAIADLELEADALAEDIIASDQKATEAKEEAGLAKSAVDAYGLITKETADKMVNVEQIVADAKTDASNALSQAGQAATDAQTAMGNAQTAMGDAQTALSKASDAESTVTTLSKDVDTIAGKVALKAEQTEVDTVKGTVATHTTTLSQHATAIASKAEKSVVDTISGTVSTNTTTISQNATAISSKAEQSEVDTVKGTVSTHTSTLTQQAKEISARLTKTQVDNLVSGKGYSTVSYVDTQISATAGAIRTEMTAVEGKIDGMEIGGRNLLRNSRTVSISSNNGATTPISREDLTEGDRSFVRIKRTNVTSHPTTMSLYSIIPISDISSSVFDNEQTTVSFKARASRIVESTLFKTTYGGANNVIGNGGNITITTEWQTFEVVFPKIPKDIDGFRVNPYGLNTDMSDFYLDLCEWKIEKGNIATDWTPAPEEMLKQNDFNTFKAEYEQSAKGWNTKLTQIENADYATKTWSNQTFATPQSVTTQLASYAKTTDLNGMVTETTLATKNFITAGSVTTLLTSYAKTGDVPTATQFNSLKNRYDSMEQVIGTDKDSVARAVMTSSLWETEVSKVIDDELEQEYKTVTSRIDNVPRNDGLNYGTDTSTFRYYEYPLESTIVYGTTINVKFIMQGTTNTGQQVAIDHVNRSGDLTRVYSTNLTAGESTVSFTFDATQSLLSSGSKIRLKIYGYKSYAAYFEMWYTKDHQVPTDGTNTGAISSKITQLYNMINLSVLGKEGALSRIAIGEEGIQIDGKLLHITAKTFIDEAVIKSAMIDTLDAGKITTGELNAKNIRVINLDANSISGNEASFIRALFSGTTSTLQITSDGVNILDNIGRSSTFLDSSGIEFSRRGVNLGKLEYVNNITDSGDLNNMHGFSMRPNRNSYFGISYFKTAGATYSTRSFAVSGRTGNVYISGLIKPSEQQPYGLDITWGTITNIGTNVRIYNHDRTGGIQINNGDFSYLSSGGWRSLNGWLK